MLATCFMLVTCLAYSSTLKLKAIYLLVDFQRGTLHYIQEDRNVRLISSSGSMMALVSHNIAVFISELNSFSLLGTYPS
jgi:hypothetical protein